MMCRMILMALLATLPTLMACSSDNPVSARDAGPDADVFSVDQRVFPVDQGPALKDSKAPDATRCTAPSVGGVMAIDQPVDWSRFTFPAVPYAEVPPWTIDTPQGRLHTVTTAISYFCAFDGTIFETTKLTPAQCALTLEGHSWLSTDASTGDDPGELAYDEAWRRDYYGIFSAHLRTVNGTDRLFAVLHGEHKNYVNLAGVPMQGIINPDVRVDACPGKEDEDCFEAYNGFVALAWADVTELKKPPVATDLQDVGPILWPRFGYTVGGKKTSVGLRHPHGFVDDGWLYIYYLDGSYGGTPGGVHVARARLKDAHTPGAFATWDGSAWQRSLPPGFDRARIYEFLDQPGGASAAVVSSSTDAMVSFAVARTTTGGYVGVEEYVSPDESWGVRLRESTDLINWSAPILQIATAASYAEGTLYYPVFWAAGGGHEQIDRQDFWIHGTQEGKVSRVRVRCF